MEFNVPILPPPALPTLLLLPLLPRLRMLGRMTLLRPAPLLILLPRSSFNVRVSTEMMNLSLDMVNVAGSNFPLALTLKTLNPRKNESGTDMCSSAVLKLLRG